MQNQAFNMCQCNWFNAHLFTHCHHPVPNLWKPNQRSSPLARCFSFILHQRECVCSCYPCVMGSKQVAHCMSCLPSRIITSSGSHSPDPHRALMGAWYYSSNTQAELNLRWVWSGKPINFNLLASRHQARPSSKDTRARYVLNKTSYKCRFLNYNPDFSQQTSRVPYCILCWCSFRCWWTQLLTLDAIVISPDLLIKVFCDIHVCINWSWQMNHP